MLGSCVCGVSNLPYEEQHEFHTTARRSSISRSKSSKNPYAARGLGEFCTLLAEIEKKREKIYAQFGPEEISFIWFAYSKDNHCKPIVVKVKGRGEPRTEISAARHKSGPIIVSSAPLVPKQAGDSSIDAQPRVVKKEEEKRTLMGLDRVQTCYYLSLIFVLALLVLAVFGRTATILGTTIGWYVLPSVTPGRNDSRRLSMKKKDYGKKRLSEKKMLGQGKLSFKGYDAKTTSHGGHGRCLDKSVSMEY
ncbi:hypothetical protein Ancab_028822 [Ancistrocladus abbreviatus]